MNNPHHNPRSPHWPTIRHHFIESHPFCVVCGSRKSLNVHHKYPLHYCVGVGRPDLELDPDNLITLCFLGEDHHCFLGHLGDYCSYNPDILKDVVLYKNKTRKEIINDRQWRMKKRNRPPKLSQMTSEQKKELRKFLDERFPPQISYNTRGARRRRTLKYSPNLP